MFTAVLITIAKIWKPKCPETNELINETGVVYTQNGILLSY